MERLTGSPGRLQRLGVVMEPQMHDPLEAGGVLNPAVVRGPDGRLYLLPRLVAAGNYSRIGLSHVVVDRRGDPVGVERLGVVLEPKASYERNPHNGGGVEDPRITALGAGPLYIMTYTALGPTGPRIAAAVSRDLAHWQRWGLVHFAPCHGLDLALVDNKDAVLFPEPVRAPDGRSALALLHRPDFHTAPPDASAGLPPVLLHDPPSMWISYAPLTTVRALGQVTFEQHTLLVRPRQGWERLKVGAGAPPVRTPRGWLVFYHGVAAPRVAGCEQPLRYSAGVLLLDADDPRKVVYRSAESILAPDVPAELVGVVPGVVFPTGVDVRPDSRLDVYYGMADSRIGVAYAGLADLLMPVQAHAA